MARIFNTKGNIYPNNEDSIRLRQLETALFESFGPDTLRDNQAHGWDPEDPANNQCAVAALVINRLLPQFDQIVNDNRPEVDHYWGKNSTTEEEIDFTRCQRQLKGIVPQIRRTRKARELLEGEKSIKARTAERFEILLRRTQDHLKSLGRNISKH